ncbi:MAG: hypothetical protein CMJ48_12115 [Planctomycetaceae bacterium]|nr:hypothetical protein [Planctomycetaceae bacterium]
MFCPACWLRCAREKWDALAEHRAAFEREQERERNELIAQSHGDTETDTTYKNPVGATGAGPPKIVRAATK